jgi:F0F1-type ATP synthase membrane subunit b/b'
MSRRIKEREATREGIDRETTRDREEAAVLRRELETRLAHAEEEAEAIIARARDEAENLRQATMQETEAEVERVLSEAHAEADRIRKQALDISESETLDAILEISARLIGQAAPPEFHNALVQQLSDRIWEMGETEMRRVEDFRRSLGDRTPTAHVISARPLSPEQQGLLIRTLTALADRHVNLELKIDPELAAGLRVRLADMIVDNSMTELLAQLRQDTLESLKGSVTSA